MSWQKGYEGTHYESPEAVIQREQILILLKEMKDHYEYCGNVDGTVALEDAIEAITERKYI